MRLFLAEVGRRIAILRVKKGLTQEEFAELANLNKNFLGNIELGKQTPTIITIKKITNALNITISEFFNDL